MNIEQIKQILEGAPEGAVYFDGDDYSDKNGFVWEPSQKRWYDCGHFVCGTELKFFRTIIAQAEEIDRLRGVLKECDEYLNYNKDTTIGSGSALHRSMQYALTPPKGEGE